MDRTKSFEELFSWFINCLSSFVEGNGQGIIIGIIISIFVVIGFIVYDKLG